MELRINHREAPALPTLSLVDALDEMIVWVNDERKFIPSHDQAWRSAASDLQAAVAESGAHVRGLVDAELVRFSVDYATERARKQESRSLDLKLLKSVRAIVVSDEGVRALWADLAGSAQELSWSNASVHRRNLVRLHAARGHDASERFRVVAGIVRDRVLDVCEAQQELGEPSSLDALDLATAISSSAGLSEDDRLELASRYMCVPFRESHFVVWLAVERATMPRVMMPVGAGSVTFYDSRLIGETLKAEVDDRSHQLPDEIRKSRAFVNHLPEGEFTLLARVDMGVRHGSFVARDARTRLLTLLAPAPRVYPADWKVLPGSVVFRNGESVGYSTFEDVAETSTRYRLDGVAERWLEGAAGALEPHLAAPKNAPLARLLKLVEWDAAHRDGDALTRVLLAVRTIETIAANHVGSMSWHKLLHAYRDDFVWSELRNELASIAWSVLHAYDRHPNDRLRTRLREILLEVVIHGRGATTTRLDMFLGHLPELCEIWDVDVEWGSDAVVERVVRLEEMRSIVNLWADGVAFRRRMDAIADRLKLQESRLVRVRNAAQHGGPILDESVQSVVDAADRARQQIIADMLDGLVNGRARSTTLAAVRGLSQRRADTLASTGSPLAALDLKVESG